MIYQIILCEETLSTKEYLEIETQNNDTKFIIEFSREIVNGSTTLVSTSKEVFSIGNVVNIKHFSDLTSWSVDQRTFCYYFKKKHSGRKLNLNRVINTSEIRFTKLLWIQENQAKLENSDNFNNLKNSVRLQNDSNHITVFQ